MKTRKNTNITEIRVEEVDDHEESKHFFRVYFYYENGKIEIMGESTFTDGINVKFSHQFEEVKIDMKNFYKKITEYFDMLYKKNPPQPLNYCGCRMHKFFYNEEKLKELN